MKKKIWYKSKGGIIGGVVGYVLEVGFLFMFQNVGNVGDNFSMNGITNIISRTFGFFNNTFNIGALIMTLVFVGIGFLIGKYVGRKK